MYLWKIKNLKQDIKENKLTKKNNLLYASLFSILYFGLLIQDSSVDIISIANRLYTPSYVSFDYTLLLWADS